MGPELHHLAGQDVVELSKHILQLYRQALPDPADRGLFERLMHEARGKGLNWFEGVEYAARQRRMLR